LAAELTQEALAERAGLSVNGIQKLERGGTHPYRDTVRRLVEALRLTPDDAIALQAAAHPAPRSRDGVALRDVGDDDLPTSLTSFIGREREKNELARLLQTARLVTLTGVGGSGKTRLSLEIARLVRADYPDGVKLIELAPIGDPALVPQAVASALTIREIATQPLVATLIAGLRQRRLLLLLDNCEHLVQACAELCDRLIRACPGLHILATSREPLRIHGELVRAVAPLSIEPTPMGTSEAVQLFVERARAVDPRFELGKVNGHAVAQICQRLDGIPLAVELAAALVRGLSVDDIAARLDHRFRLLTSGSRAALPRQQTLQATIDWSYDLLGDGEQLLFARLSVFVGSWTLEAAEEICQGEGVDREQVLGLLLHLVDKSLVVAEEAQDGSHRYRLLDTLRQYGRERLHDSGAPLRQHATYYLSLAERAEPELNQARQAAWIEELALDQSDLLAALDWLTSQGEMQTALRLAAVLGRFWQMRGHLHEGRRRLATLLAMPGAEKPTQARARALEAAGALALYQGDMPATRALLRESLALHRQHNDERGVAWVLIYLGWMGHDSRRNRAAARFLREALNLTRQLDDRRGIAMALNLLGMVTVSDGDRASGRSYLEEAVALARDVGDRWVLALALANLASAVVVRFHDGTDDPFAAVPLIEEALSIWEELGERRHYAFSQLHMGMSATNRGELALARQMYEQCLQTFTELQDAGAMATSLTAMGYLFEGFGKLEQALVLLAASFGQLSGTGRYWRGYARLHQQQLDAWRNALGAERYDAAWTTGSAMSLDEAVSYAWQQLGSLSAGK